MAQSIIIIGPQGCGKSLNAQGLCEAFGLKHSVDLDDIKCRRLDMPLEDHIILATERPRDTKRLHCLSFSEAMKKVKRPHPMTPKQGA